MSDNQTNDMRVAREEVLRTEVRSLRAALVEERSAHADTLMRCAELATELRSYENDGFAHDRLRSIADELHELVKGEK